VGGVFICAAVLAVREIAIWLYRGFVTLSPFSSALVNYLQDSPPDTLTRDDIFLPRLSPLEGRRGLRTDRAFFVD